MVENQSKSANQAPAEGPPVRIPPKRTCSETKSAIQKQLLPEQTKEVTESVRVNQRRRTNPPQPRLDAKTMIKLVPTLFDGVEGLFALGSIMNFYDIYIFNSNT